MNTKIIWNPIQDHHLRMYCDTKNIDIIIWPNWYISQYKQLEKGNVKIINTNIKLEPKQLYQQSEETLWKIFNYLIDRKNE